MLLTTPIFVSQFAVSKFDEIFWELFGQFLGRDCESSIVDKTSETKLLGTDFG